MSNNTDFLIEPAFATPNAYTLVFAPDNNYTPYFGVALKSLIINSKPNELYDIILFENDISERNKKLLAAMLPKNFSLRFFNLWIEAQENILQSTKISNNKLFTER